MVKVGIEREKGSEVRGRKIAPGPKGTILIGNVIALRRKGPLQFYTDIWQQYGDVVRHRIGSDLIHLIVHPDYVERVLSSHRENYPKGTLIDRRAEELFGKGLILLDGGEEWARQRRIMDPPFSHEEVPQFFAAMEAGTHRLMDRWQSVKSPLDIHPDMMRLSMSIVSGAIFSLDAGESYEHVAYAFTYLTGILPKRLLALYNLPLFIPTPANRRLLAAKNVADTFISGNVEASQRRTESGQDLLSHLLTTRDEQTDTGMTKQEVHDELMITLVAGAENIGLLLTWASYLVGRHPAVEERLHAEVDSILGGRSVTLEDIPKLTYTRRILEETLRLYPALWMLGRNVVRADEIGGYHIPAGSVVFFSSYLTHRHPEFWERPEVFDPDRFTPERSQGLPKYAYIPFAGGPRKCIANKFSMMAGQVALATMAQRYQLRPLSDLPVLADGATTLRPAGSVVMTVEPR